MSSIRGKSLKSVAMDIAEGYVIVNPIFLKSIEAEELRGLMEELTKLQHAVRSEKFPHLDTMAIRRRNMRLQKLHSAAMIIRNFARDRKIMLV